MKLGPEEYLQVKLLIPYLDICVKQGRLRYIHVPNGGKRHMSVAKQMKAMGVKKGFPDLIIMANHFIGFIEVKRPRVRDPETGRLSKKGALKPEQKEWRDYLWSMGHEWALVESLEEMVGVLRTWELI